ncbi:Teashirt-like 1 [Holothuria leucospilota]|uniref:Teashirt-like 1 n=1 Tax=Holothuria leucospilota TaxID=206669 RepID=A0A9Q1HDC5_HOLLE|nr:Teashirt-like 1 [Holothuria leucospilota]
MPRRKQLAPKRLKGNIEKSSEGDWKEGENVQDEEEDEDVETSKDEDKTSDGTVEVSNSPNASWSFKFTPFGSNTERVMRTSATASGSGISKVFSKGIWYPDDSKCSTENNNPHGESSHSEGENDKLKRKAGRSESHSSKSPEKEKKCERRTTRVNSGQSDREVEDTVQRHSSSSLIRENLRHYFLDRLKSSGKVVKDEDDQNNQRKMQREEKVGRTSPERANSHGTRSNYTHTVLWMPPKVSDKSPNEPLDSGVGTSSKVSNDHSKGKRNSFLESSKFQERLNLAKEVPTSSSSHHQGREGRRDEGISRSSPSHSSTSECTKKSPSRMHEENGDSSVSDTSSPSDYYHSYHSAGMAYYQSPFMGYGLYPSYPNFVYPYNYGYVVAVPGGLFIPMGNSYSQTSGLGPTSSLGPHKDAPLDLSACSTTKKEEDVKPDMVKKEEPPPPSSSSSSSIKHQTKRAAGSSKKTKGEKTMVLWKKVPRHAMMMDMAQLSVLEKVHVLYTTESVFLCFICSDCHALFNSLDLLVLHAVGTAHTSRNDLDDRAMELKGFDVIPVDKITKKQKTSEKKPEFSFESPLQSTVSLHRRRLPAGKDFLLKSRDVYKCSVCPETFPNFLRYTMHMNETGHRRKSVRYSDVYKAQRQVKKILKCMNCEKSFMTLEELTMHMIKTKHYSDIAGGFANQADLEEDAEYDQLDHVHENHLEGVEHQSTVHPRLPPSHKSHDGNIADGTSSESENPTSLRGSPMEQCRSHSPAVRSKEPEVLMDGMDHKVAETWKGNEEMVARGLDGPCQRSVEQMATEGEGQYSVTASTSQSYPSPSPGTKRDMRELGGDETDSVSKKVKVEPTSVAGDEDDYQTLAGYETENEYEDEDEEEFVNEDYDMGSFSDSHAGGTDQENCFLTSDLSRKKLRRRIYKHSLLYQCRKNRTEGKKEVSAFDGLYNWAKSLGLLSSAAATQPTPVAQMPKAVVKCDGKYVDPDNFDVTLPYGGKVHPDVNPLSKLSSMVETTQIKQSNTKSFESNFIMDRAYFNFEKNHGNPSQGAVAINPTIQSDSEGGNDSHAVSRTWLSSPTEEQHCSGTSPKTQHLSKEMQNLKESHRFQNSSRQLPSVSSQLHGWPVDGTISKDAVLERLILKAYNRPSRSGFTLPSTSEEQCTCSVKPEIKTSTGDLETRSSKTNLDGQHDTENDTMREADPENCESLLGSDRNVCYKCSGKNRTLEANIERGLPLDSGTLRQDQRLSEAANTNERVEVLRDTVNEGDSDTSVAAEGPEDEQKRKSDERSVETYGNLFFSRDRHSSKSHSQRNVDRGCLQDLIYGPRDSPGVREVKFTWAEAIDTLISRIFEPESETIEQSVPDSLHRDIPCKSEKEMTMGSEVEEGEKVCGGDGQEEESEDGPENSECNFDDDQSRDECQDGENASCDRREKKRGDSGEDVDGEKSDDVNSNKESICKAVNGDTAKDDHLNGLRGKKGQEEKVPDVEEATENGCQGDEMSSPDNVAEKVSVTDKDGESCENIKKETAKSSDDSSVDKPVEREDASSEEAVRSSPDADDSFEHRSNSPHERFSDARNSTSKHSEITAHYNDMSSMSRYSGHGFKYSMAKRFFDLSMSPSDGPNDSSKRSENFSNEPKNLSEETEETPSEAGGSVERSSSEAPHGSDSICSKSRRLKPPDFHKEKHHLPGYFHFSGPPPLIPNADASTKAIQRLEELTRKPSVTNVKEMILNKIQEEVERLTASDYESSQVSFHLPPRPSYLFPCVGNNNDGDASGKSLKSLEELSKCSPLSPFQRMPADTRLMVSKDGLPYRHDVGLKYLPPSATPESNVSVIQSLEKLSNEHPVLRRKEQPIAQPPPSSSLRETPLSAPEKLQYLPPSFGTETSNANSIQSLERFSSQHPFFSIPEGQPHSSLSSSSTVPRRIKEELTDDGCLTEKQNQWNKSSSNATPVDFSMKPKEHPLQSVAFKMAGSNSGSEGGIVIKVEPEDESEPFESTLSKSKENREQGDDDSDCDELQVPSSSSKTEDPLLALDNLVRMKQSTEVSPSPSKIALELVSKDMKSPLYILPPDEVSSQSDKNPLEEMNKMVKLT